MPCQTENTPSFNEKVLQIAYQPEQVHQKEHQISRFAPTAKLPIPVSNSFISNTKSSISYLTRPSHIELESERQQDIEKRQLIGKQLKSLYYTQIAFVIQSKVEFHDAFKMLLQQIYESLRDPK